MRKLLGSILIVAVGILIAACNGGTEAVSPLPVPTITSPIEVRTVSPIATPPPEIGLNEPIYVGDVQVSGFGPPGLPIRLYDVGQTGDELGSTVIGEGAAFTIDLTEPLHLGQRVGLALGNLSGTDFDFGTLERQAIIKLPVIGLLFADVTVQAKP